MVCLLLGFAAADITSVSELNAFETATLRVGFLSRGNYESVQSVLPQEVANNGKLEVVIFKHLEDLEDAVETGTVDAGLTTSRPLNDDGLLWEFGAGIVTPKAPFFVLGEAGQGMREAVDAAVVRVIAAGIYQQLETKYFKSNNFVTVAALTCSPDPDRFPFPEAATLPQDSVLREVLASKVLKVGSLGETPANWGYQGDYTVEPATGFWPEYEAAIYEELNKEYGELQVERVWTGTSAGVIDSLLDGNASMIAPYWTVPAFYKDRARSHHMALGCTVLGTEQWFFTKRTPTSAAPVGEPASAGVVAAIIAVVVVAVLFLVLLVVMIRKERAGSPLFTPLTQSDPDQEAGAINAEERR